MRPVKFLLIHQIEQVAPYLAHLENVAKGQIAFVLNRIDSKSLPALFELRGVDHKLSRAAEVRRSVLHRVVGVRTVFFAVSGSRKHFIISLTFVDLDKKG